MALDALLGRPEIARLAARLRGHRGATVPPYEGSRYAAISLILHGGADGRPELLMIKRSEYAGDPWSGHVACPGGRMEPGDPDLEWTAIRETREETGIDLARDGQILGTLDDVAPRTPALPPIIIRPFVALSGSAVTLTLSHEVAEAFWIPVDALRATLAWGTERVQVRGAELEVRAFRHAEHVVWGLTERVLSQFVALL